MSVKAGNGSDVCWNVAHHCYRGGGMQEEGKKTQNIEINTLSWASIHPSQIHSVLLEGIVVF